MNVSRIAAPPMMMSALSGLIPGSILLWLSVEDRMMLVSFLRWLRRSVPGRPPSERTAISDRFTMVPDEPMARSTLFFRMALAAEDMYPLTCRFMTLYVLSSTGFWYPRGMNRSVMRMAPSLRLSRNACPLPLPSASSVLPPPMSIIRAVRSASSMPELTPRKISLASSMPEMMPRSRSASSFSRSSSTFWFLASLAAEVATAMISSAP